MRAEQISRVLSDIDRQLLTDAAPGAAGMGNRRKRRFRLTAAAAVLVIVLVLSFTLGRGGSLRAYALQQAKYPNYNAQEQQENMGAGTGLADFFSRLMPLSLSGSEGKNKVFSPLGTYLTLAMLSGLCEGETQSQILSALRAESAEALQDQAGRIWLANYENREKAKNVLSASLWMDENTHWEKEAVRALADRFRASSFSGRMGDPTYDQCFQARIDKQTDGFLKTGKEETRMDPSAVLQVVTALSFSAKWGNSFEKENNREGVFHAGGKDVPCTFMNQLYNFGKTGYYGEKFSAVELDLLHTEASLWLILPDEGISPDELLRDEQLLYFLSHCAVFDPGHSAGINTVSVKIDLTLPKFDIREEADLRPVLENLGITDCFLMGRADFSPLASDGGVWVSRLTQMSRIAADERGLEASSRVKGELQVFSVPPEETAEMVFDRPFLFVLTNADSLPLLAGIVNEP